MYSGFKTMAASYIQTYDKYITLPRLIGRAQHAVFQSCGKYNRGWSLREVAPSRLRMPLARPEALCSGIVCARTPAMGLKNAASCLRIRFATF